MGLESVCGCHLYATDSFSVYESLCEVGVWPGARAIGCAGGGGHDVILILINTGITIIGLIFI